MQQSSIGVIYLFLPERHRLGDKKSTPNNGIVFKLNHYYSLLALIKLFRLSVTNRLLFYYANDCSQPVSNHYNQWLNDSHWRDKLPMESIKFIQLNNNNSVRCDPSDFNLYDLVHRVRQHAQREFDFPHHKRQFLLATSDVIVGPKLKLCFTTDSDDFYRKKYESGIVDIDSIRSRIPGDCYRALNDPQSTNGAYSFLYQMELTHSANDFSGVLVWNLDYANTRLDESLVSRDNVYKCMYKQDILILDSQRPDLYQDTYCIFGYESNQFEPPYLQNIFFDEYNYFSKVMRSYLYNGTSVVKYVRNETKPFIPNVVHLIWFGEEYKPLKFIEYLCLKSILEVLRPEKVKVHGDVEPSCQLWRQIRKDPRVVWVHMDRPMMKYGQNFSQSPIQHMADVARLEVMYAEGGIYSDLDVLWVRPVDRYRYMDVQLIASNDLTSYCYQFPNNIQIGVFLAPPKSPFIKKWLDVYAAKYHLFPGDYVAVSMCEPYKIYEKEPHNVYIDNRLQMIYFNGWSVFIPRYF